MKMSCIEREQHCLFPHRCVNDRGKEDGSVDELKKVAKPLLGEKVLQNLFDILEAHFARPAEHDEATGEVKDGGELNKAETICLKDKEAASTQQKNHAETKCYYRKSLPAFADLLQRIEHHVLQQRVSEKKPDSIQPKSCSKDAATDDKPLHHVRQYLSKPSSTESPESPKDFPMQIKASDFKPEDINVKIKNGYVTVQALKEERDEENGTFRMQKLYKSFKLSADTDPANVTCEMSDEGLLTIKAPLPKPSTPIPERVVIIRRRNEH